ncbi:hypothetical protein ACJX0J_030997 [Zea mays]
MQQLHANDLDGDPQNDAVAEICVAASGHIFYFLFAYASILQHNMFNVFLCLLAFGLIASKGTAPLFFFFSLSLALHGDLGIMMAFFLCYVLPGAYLAVIAVLCELYFNLDIHYII